MVCVCLKITCLLLSRDLIWGKMGVTLDRTDLDLVTAAHGCSHGKTESLSGHPQFLRACCEGLATRCLSLLLSLLKTRRFLPISLSWVLSRGWPTPWASQLGQDNLYILCVSSAVLSSVDTSCPPHQSTEPPSTFRYHTQDSSASRTWKPVPAPSRASSLLPATVAPHLSPGGTRIADSSASVDQNFVPSVRQGRETQKGCLPPLQ